MRWLFLFVFLFSFEAFGRDPSQSFDLCVHASIYTGMNQATQTMPEYNRFQRFTFNYLGDMMLGHASVTIRHNGQTIRTYGYWPEENLMTNSSGDSPTEAEHSFTYENGERISIRSEQLCYPVTFAQLESIENRAKEYEARAGAWTNFNNCVSFAAHIFQETSGIQVTTALPLPLALYRTIQERKSNLPQGNTHNYTGLENDSLFGEESYNDSNAEVPGPQ